MSVITKSWWVVTENESVKPLNKMPSDPISVKTMFHDLYHHFPNDDGTYEMEFMAVGAYYYIHGSDSTNKRESTWERHIAAELFNLLAYMYRPVKLCDKRCPTIKKFDKELCRLYLNQDIKSSKDWNDREFDMQDLIEAIKWFLHGYYKASLRYRNLFQDDLNEYANCMIKQFEELHKSIHEYVYVYVKADFSAARVEYSVIDFFDIGYDDGYYYIKDSHGISNYKSKSYSKMLDHLNRIGLSHFQQEF